MTEETKNYKKETIKMVEKLENEKIITLIYGFVRRGYREEKAGR